MKTANRCNFRVRVVVLVTLLCATSFFSAVAAGQDKQYEMALDFNQGLAQDNQLLTIFREGMDALKEKTGIDVTLKMFNDTNEFFEAMKTGEYDFLYTTGFFMEAMFQYDYNPIYSYTMYGVEKAKWCLYTTNDLYSETIEDYRGMTAYSSASRIDYFLLYDMIGDAPDNFFRPLKISPDVGSTLYALALGEADVAYAQNTTVEYFKSVNPGAVKNTREIVCSQSGYMIPMLSSSSVPQEDVETIVDFTMNIYKEDIFKKYQPLVKMAKWKFIEVKKEDYEWQWELYRKGMENGWDNEYEKWIKYSKK